jgi:penicillin amidase
MLKPHCCRPTAVAPAIRHGRPALRAQYKPVQAPQANGASGWHTGPMSFQTSVCERRRQEGSARSLSAIALLCLAFLLGGCALLQPLPQQTSAVQRLEAMPTEDLPLHGRVSIHWNEHLVPFIHAETDADAAFALGLVHAHLRLGQMAMYKRIAQGRISEMAGPLTADIDHGIRILDFGRAAEAIEAALPLQTRSWLARYVAGINHYQARVRPLPFEYAALGMEPEPWTIRDVLTFGRLAGSDVTWIVWASLLELRARGDWPELWARLLDSGVESMPSFAPTKASAWMDLIAGLSRSGSNSLVVAGRRSATGGALIASDPHLGINIPNIWLIVGLKSPSYHAVGLMVPGLPVFAIGRNPQIAWGGTNMRAAASDLVDLSHVPKEAIVERRVTVPVRWLPDRDVVLRDSPWGPVISDAPQLAAYDLPPLALRWTGHDASDEISAMLQASRARTFAEFRDAFVTFSVPGQNMLYADAAGNIGQVMAVRVPERDAVRPEDMISSANAAARRWQDTIGPLALPFAYNPGQGFLASANNRPTDAGPTIGYFYSPDDRVARMKELIGPEATIDTADLRALQQDVHVASSLALRDAIVANVDLDALQADLDDRGREVLHRVMHWDGKYGIGSRGAVAFELVRHAFTAGFYTSFMGEDDAAAFASAGAIKSLLVEDIRAAEPERLTALVRQAIETAAPKLQEYPTWGAMHRLALRHPLAFAPVIGSRFRFADYPTGGSTNSLMKTAHAPADARHDTRYGANARHISDLADIDRNYFVLLGGQDGWLNSAAFLDQVPLWRDGRYIEVPLDPERIEAEFGYEQILSGSPGGKSVSPLPPNE